MPKKIVVADGKKFILKKACQILKEGGYEVIPAANGVEAQSQAKSTNADLILADYLMPEKSGLGLVFEMRNTGDKTPVIIMSESPMVTQETISKSGANGLVKKPLDGQKLLATVKQVLAS